MDESDPPIQVEVGGEINQENEVNDQQQEELMIEDDDKLDPQSEMQIRHSTRVRKPTTRYPPDEYVVVAEDDEPQSYDEVMMNRDKEEWERAMQDEIKSLHKNQIYELTKLPQERRVLKGPKTKIVVKGYNQKKGVDFVETFSLVVKITSIRTV